MKIQRIVFVAAFALTLGVLASAAQQQLWTRPQTGLMFRVAA